MNRTIVAIAGFALTAAVGPTALADPHPARASKAFRTTEACPIMSSSAWAVRVDAAAGPDTAPVLVVTGAVGVKPAATATLRLEPFDLESDPPQRVVTLLVTVPREPTIDLLERRAVRGQWPLSAPIGTIHIRCGDQTLASLRDIVIAD